MNERYLGYRIRQILNQDLALDESTLERLRAARAQALARQRVVAPSAALAWFASVAGARASITGSMSLFSRILLPALVLLIGLGAIYSRQQSQAMQQLVDIDTQVLASDLPVHAYLDQGFVVWLKQSSQ